MNNSKSILTYLKNLISFPSITPNDAGCQEYLITYFESLGFTCLIFNNPPVKNFFAYYQNAKPLIVFAGHTDVVDPGNLNLWHSPPFILNQKEDKLYGRGVADMKGSIAAMMVLAQDFSKNHKSFTGSLGFLITSGEEGNNFAQGTPYIMVELIKLGIKPSFCIVGEPSSELLLGDTIKNGRRGSLTGRLSLQGKQGHVAYPHLALNPIHLLSPALIDLISIEWDSGSQYFPPTSLQLTYISSGEEDCNNVIPQELKMNFNFRFSNSFSARDLQEKVEQCFNKYHLSSKIVWQLNGEPFLTLPGKLLDASIAAIEEVTGLTAKLSTAGGTSDARFIAPYGIEVIEIGPINKTIHQINEEVSLRDLELLSDVYIKITQKLL